MRVYVCVLFSMDEIKKYSCVGRNAKIHLKNSSEDFLKCVIYNPSGCPISVCNRKDGYYFYTPAALEKPLENI